MSSKHRGSTHSLIVLLLGVVATAAQAESTRHASEWISYAYDAAGARYTPLKQITRDNVRDLKVAWTYHMRPADVAAADAKSFVLSEATPLVIDGTMYLPTPYGEVVALDADSGKRRWAYPLPNGDQATMRGVAYWPGDQTTKPRLVFGTRSGKLMALDAATGKPAADFGTLGIVDLKTPELMNGNPNGRLTMTSPPFIFRDLVITGSRVQEFPPRGVAGDVRAWDVRTGRLVWTFHTVPRVGEVGHDTWQGDSWQHRSGVNMWVSPVADSKRGILYLPIASAAFDRWGVDRKGANLFSNSLVAVDGATGKYLWHFQTVHHDLWDLDMTSAILLDVKKGGRTIPAVTAVNKQALIFLLDRVTGKPIYDVQEVPVPTESNIPGEEPWPTQPMPSLPLPLARMSFNMSELTDLTPEVKERCERLVKEWRVVESKLYQPPMMGAAVAHFPGGQGGIDWGGAAFDPRQGYYIVNITNLASPAELSQQPDGSFGLAYGYRYFWDAPNRIPCQRPPWGELVAVNVNTGAIAWRSVLGVTDNLPKELRNTGRPNAGGPVATAGGVTFIGATDDKRFRAFDSATGELLWETRLRGSAYATPMTYRGRSGKQFVAVVNTGGMTGSPVTSDDVTAFALVPGSAARGVEAEADAEPQTETSLATAPLLTASSARPPSELPEGPGLQLIKQRCITCHPITQISTAPLRATSDWPGTVKRMQGLGAELTAVEAKMLIDYLGLYVAPDIDPERH